MGGGDAVGWVRWAEDQELGLRIFKFEKTIKHSSRGVE